MTDQLDIFTAVPQINENGVMDDDWSGVEKFSDEGRRGKHPFHGWEILVCQFPDGQWRSSSRYMSSNFGWARPLCARWPGHPSRALALLEAIQTFRDRLPGETSPVARRALQDVEKLASTILPAPEGPADTDRGGEIHGV